MTPRDRDARMMTMARAMSEADLQKAVIDLARLLGWRVAHFRPAKSSADGGWRTPVEADGAGFPDLVLVRGGRVLWRELKAMRGRVRDEQEDWLADLQGAGADVLVWRPDDWLQGLIELDLRRR